MLKPGMVRRDPGPVPPHRASDNAIQEDNIRADCSSFIPTGAPSLGACRES